MQTERAELARLKARMTADRNWLEVFGRAYDHSYEACGFHQGCTHAIQAAADCRVKPEASPLTDASVSTSPFGLGDVARFSFVSSFSVEDDDQHFGGQQWVACGQLEDGRFFLAEAGYGSCDWSCEYGRFARAYVATSEAAIREFAMTAPVRAIADKWDALPEAERAARQAHYIASDPSEYNWAD